MNLEIEVLRILDETLGLDGRSASFTRDTLLLGAMPELDSMAVVSLISGLEEQFGLLIDDGDLDGRAFATVGSLVDFVGARVAA